MDNYICINGKRLELTQEQLATLNLTPALTLAQLSEWARQGVAAEHVKIHDRLTADGLELEIVGIGHDEDEGGNRNTVTLRTVETVANRRMNDGRCPGGYKDTELREWLNDEYINELDEIKRYVRPVKKLCRTSDNTPYEVTDKLWLFSESELFGSAIYSPGEEGARYEAFATSKDRVCTDEDGDTVWYWERSSFASNSTDFCIVCSSGSAYNYSASNSCGVAFGFCV